MEETWKTSLKAALHRLGTQLPSDDDRQWDDEWMLAFEELRTAPRNAKIRWYSDSLEDAEHVYAEWLDVYVIWPPGRAPRGPGLPPDGKGAFMAGEDSRWMWVVSDPEDADEDSWTPGSRSFSRVVIIQFEAGVDRGWSCNWISKTLSEWCAELLGRPDLVFQCCH